MKHVYLRAAPGACFSSVRVCPRPRRGLTHIGIIVGNANATGMGLSTRDFGASGGRVIPTVRRRVGLGGKIARARVMLPVKGSVLL